MAISDERCDGVLSRVREARRRHILEAAQRVFLREGYHGATMERVAEEAGVSKQTLYNYFADKESLFIALAETWKERGGLFQLRDAIAGLASAADPAQHLAQALERALAGVGGRLGARDPAALVRLMMEVAQERGDASSRLSACLRSVLTAEGSNPVRAAFEQAIAAGRVHPIDASVAAAALVDIVIGYGLLQPLIFGEENADLTPERMAAGLTDLLLYGLLPRDHPAPCRDDG